jgi:hypothetical protein
VKPHQSSCRGYWAPEFIGSGVITLKADIYGLGVIFLEVLTGCKGSDKVEEVITISSYSRRVLYMEMIIL